MRQSAGAKPGRRVQGHLLGALLASGLLVIFGVACGITLGAGEEETEIFKQLSVEGDFRLGGALMLTLEYEQPYPIRVPVVCDVITEGPAPTATLEPGGATPTPTAIVIPMPRSTPTRRVIEILTDALPSNEDDVPPAEATPVVGTIERSFTGPDRAGDYIVRCFTPDDENNSIQQPITIVPVLAPSS